RNDVNLDKLVELATCCGVDLSQVTVPHSDPTVTTVAQPPSKKRVESSLLIKIEGGSTPLSYRIKVWLVSDSQVYQDRMRGLSDSVSQPISEESAATPLVNGQEIQVQSEQTQAEEIKRFLGELFKSIWTKQGLRRLNPHVTFFVPDQLLAIDFHNIQWGVRGDILGRKVPVSVSCLGRFDESEGVNEVINEYREYWIERWQMLEDYGDRPLSEHIEHLECDEDNPDVDITCPQSFQCWLEEKDDEREWQVSGLGLYSPHGDLAKAFISFLLGGVPFIFWPSRVLDPGEVSELEQRMGVVPAEFLREFKSCRLRLGSRTKDAGPMSILLDNPYLCPPDCEFDY
ncbi:MAG: hypothetical protein VKJ64_14080, partial [Leptolyngbyaceae bacterium]|nr:hypothetical protein [Leptolyngbyaceae bacterium]